MRSCNWTHAGCDTLLADLLDIDRLTSGVVDLTTSATELSGLIVDNLVGNATKHTVQDTPITVEVAPTTDGATVTVADHGPGIPPEVADTIFQPFTQSPDSKDHHSPGTGRRSPLPEGGGHRFRSPLPRRHDDRPSGPGSAVFGVAAADIERFPLGDVDVTE